MPTEIQSVEAVTNLPGHVRGICCCKKPRSIIGGHNSERPRLSHFDFVTLVLHFLALRA